METFLAGLRVVVSLAVVLGLLWMLQRRLTRGSRKTATGRPVTIVTKQAISPKASVVIIDVEGTRLLLGVTEHAVSVLQTTEAPAPAIQEAPATQLAAAQASTMQASGAKAFAETMTRVTSAKTTKQPVVQKATAARKTATAPKSTELASVSAFTGQVNPAGGMLAGSILSPATWKQLAATLRQGR